MKKKVTCLEVSSDGHVYFEGKRLIPLRSTRGYGGIRFSLHRLVAHTFHGPPPSSKHVVDHIDGNPRHNAAENLRWITQAENCRQGAQRRPRKLSQRQISEIYEMRPAPRTTLRQLAESFNVSVACVSAIRCGVNRKPGSRGSNRGILTADQVRQVREWRPPTITAAVVARKYNVSDATILNIWSGKTTR